jgi:hypothetical protein
MGLVLLQNHTQLLNDVLRVIRQITAMLAPIKKSARRGVVISVKTDSHIACRAHASPMPFP